MKKKIAIIGGGGLSREILENINVTKYDVVGFVDDNKIKDCNYLGSLKDFKNWKKKVDYLVFGFGAVDRFSLEKRSEYIKKIKKIKIPFLNIISSKAIISPDVKLGKGIYIASGVIINSKAVISDFTIINNNSTIGHNVKIKENNIISGNVFIGGGTIIGSETLIGPGVNIIQNVVIGKKCIISIGSNILGNIPNGKLIIPNFNKSL